MGLVASYVSELETAGRSLSKVTTVSIPEVSTWDLLWTKWYWGSVSSNAVLSF
jgi:hypothetical protein